MEALVAFFRRTCKRDYGDSRESRGGGARECAGRKVGCWERWEEGICKGVCVNLPIYVVVFERVSSHDSRMSTSALQESST